MKINRIIKILIIALIGICIVSTASNAAIEIKKTDTTEKHKNITASTAFDYCYYMRAYSSSLGANSLDPHLVLNADWAAFTYLGFSGYGSMYSFYGNNKSASFQNSGGGYVFQASSTNNATGVYTMEVDRYRGAYYTWTASIMGDNTNQYANSIYQKINTKYVEQLSPIRYS